MKRLFDFFAALFGLIFLMPIFLVIALWVAFDSKGPIFYKQVRVGRDNKDFTLLKFRTMKVDSDKKGLLTVGDRDNRVTNSGYYLRKYKLDEFPQLINILKGDMSFVGPRPEVRKYVDLYTEEQMKVLTERPGLTDIASITYINESEILAAQENPEKYYIDVLMQQKLAINLQYIATRNLLKDIGIMFQTIGRIVSR